MILAVTLQGWLHYSVGLYEVIGYNNCLIIYSDVLTWT